MSTTKQDLIAIFTAGIESTSASDPGPDNDGGSCNFDTPTLTAPHIREDSIEAAAIEAGCSVTKIKWLGSTCYWVGLELRGQANRRTKMAEAATSAMNEKIAELGRDRWDVSTYYQMD